MASLLAASDQSGYATLKVNMTETKRGKTYRVHPEWEEDDRSLSLFGSTYLCRCAFSHVKSSSLSTDQE